MMRKWGNNLKPVAELYESDQSISEDDSEDNLSGDCISLGGTADKKGQGQILSQLEILRDARGLEHITRPSNTPLKRDARYCQQDEIDNMGKSTCLIDRVSKCISDEENISDDEENNMLLGQIIFQARGNSQRDNSPVSGIARKDEECAWSAVNREVNDLVRVNENAACSSSQAVFPKENKSCKGGRCKAKPKFSFHLQSHKNVGDPFMPSKAMQLLEESKSTKSITVEQSMSDLLEFFKGEKIEQSNIHAMQDDVTDEENNTKHSMAELLNTLHETNASIQGNTEVISRTKDRLQLVVKRNINSLGDRTLDGDKSPGISDTDSSNDEKDYEHNLEHNIHESRRKKSMADQFQEAIGAASTRDQDNHLALGTGLFGKLQQVIQNERERDMEFMNRLSVQASFEGSYFDVIILSRWLEAKLTVCSCTLIQQKEDTEWVDNPEIEPVTGRTSTIMFSSRSCGDVELEAGNMIRIHSPWKEVSMGKKNETVILSTYFSQIST